MPSVETGKQWCEGKAIPADDHRHTAIPCRAADGWDGRCGWRFCTQQQNNPERERETVREWSGPWSHKHTGKATVLYLLHPAQLAVTKDGIQRRTGLWPNLTGSSKAKGSSIPGTPEGKDSGDPTPAVTPSSSSSSSSKFSSSPGARIFLQSGRRRHFQPTVQLTAQSVVPKSAQQVMELPDNLRITLHFDTRDFSLQHSGNKPSILGYGVMITITSHLFLLMFSFQYPLSSGPYHLNRLQVWDCFLSLPWS